LERISKPAFDNKPVTDSKCAGITRETVTSSPEIAPAARKVPASIRCRGQTEERCPWCPAPVWSTHINPDVSQDTPVLRCNNPVGLIDHDCPHAFAKPGDIGFGVVNAIYQFVELVDCGDDDTAERLLTIILSPISVNRKVTALSAHAPVPPDLAE
jgi:hypothetical protein